MAKITGALLLAGMFGATVSAEIAPPLFGCEIKGNISVNTGEKIYHLPGQYYYSDTRISLLQGERWFCSEEAAQTAGWRKARQ